MIDYFLENGADINKRDVTGLNAFEMAVTLVNYESALLLYQRAGMMTPPEQREELYVTIGGKNVNTLYRQKFDVDLFFQYLENGVENVERSVFYEKLRKEQEEWEKKDLVVDTRETWGEWFRRTKDFKEPPLVPREELPEIF